MDQVNSLPVCQGSDVFFVLYSDIINISSITKYEEHSGKIFNWSVQKENLGVEIK